MKKQIFLIVSLFFMFPGINNIIAQQDDKDARKSIVSVLDQWHRDAANCDLDSYLGAISPTGVFIGTDAAEHWNKPEFGKFCKPYFDRKKSWNFKAIQRHVYISQSNRYAWFDELLSTQMGVCRGSGILSRREEGWKIEQYVLSATIPNEQMKEVTALKAGIDSSIIMKAVFDKYGMDGTLLIYDLRSQKYSGYHPALWDSGYLPASTFKIINTLIGIETGVIDTNTVFKWDGEKRRMRQWEKDLSLKEAFRVSCVPCYQELARKIGYERMRSYLAKLDYGKMVLTPETIDLFWLEGESRITPREQFDFLRRLYSGELPVKSESSKIIMNIMFEEARPGVRIYGKTGWAIRNGNNYGWYVGFLEKGNDVFFVVTFIQPEDNGMVDDFAVARKSITIDVLKLFSILPGEE